MNKYDEFLWVKRVIDSCTHPKHEVSCMKLIILFGTKHNDADLNRELDYYLLLKETI